MKLNQFMLSTALLISLGISNNIAFGEEVVEETTTTTTCENVVNPEGAQLGDADEMLTNRAEDYVRDNADVIAAEIDEITSQFINSITQNRNVTFEKVESEFVGANEALLKTQGYLSGQSMAGVLEELAQDGVELQVHHAEISKILEKTKVKRRSIIPGAVKGVVRAVGERSGVLKVKEDVDKEKLKEMTAIEYIEGVNNTLLRIQENAEKAREDLRDQSKQLYELVFLIKKKELLIEHLISQVKTLRDTPDTPPIVKNFLDEDALTGLENMLTELLVTRTVIAYYYAAQSQAIDAADLQIANSKQLLTTLPIQLAAAIYQAQANKTFVSLGKANTGSKRLMVDLANSTADQAERLRDEIKKFDQKIDELNEAIVTNHNRIRGTQRDLRNYQINRTDIVRAALPGLKEAADTRLVEMRQAESGQRIKEKLKRATKNLKTKGDVSDGVEFGTIADVIDDTNQ